MLIKQSVRFVSNDIMTCGNSLMELPLISTIGINTARSRWLLDTFISDRHDESRLQSKLASPENPMRQKVGETWPSTES